MTALTVVIGTAPRLIHHPNAPQRLHMVADGLLGGWLRWDGWWYVMIAAHGYTYRPGRMSSVAFFPAYPLLVRAVGSIGPGGDQLAALAITVTAGAAAFVLFDRWCRQRLDPRASRLAVLVLAVYPFAWFLYGAAYSDAFYLALALGAFTLLDTNHPVAAGLVGAIATATRPTGITLALGLIAVAFESGTSPRERRARVAAASLSLLGVVAWCAWLYARFHRPFAWIETEGAPGWNQSPGLHTWLKLGLVGRLGALPPPEIAAVVLQIAALVLFIGFLPSVARRFGRGYAVYAAAAVMFPAVSTGDFLGVGRYLLAAFPVFACIGASLASRSRAQVRITAGASAVLLVTGTALFASGFLLS